jgi:hypothetical protein
MECLSDMPRKIVSLHGRENLTEFVLLELCHPGCFDLKKAAYFVDNPDFNQFKGVAGYCTQDVCAENPELCWQDPENFTKKMQTSAFNRKVRNFCSASPKCERMHQEHLMEKIARDLALDKPDYYCWDLKNNNHGFLIFEHTNGVLPVWTKDDLERGLHLLSFCPIF